MRKISLIISILFICAYIFTGITYAAFSCNINLSPSTNEVKAGEKFTITVNTSNLRTENGIIAMGAELEYDNNLELVDFEGINGWAAPFYNENNGKLTTTRNKQMSEDGSLIKVIFKVKDDAKVGSANVTIRDLVVSSGDVDNSIANASITVSIKENTPTNPGDNNNNNNEPNNPGDSNPGNPTTPTEPGNTNQGNNSNNQGSTNTPNRPTNNNTNSKPNNSSNNNIVNNTENEINEINTNEVENITENDNNENNVTNEISNGNINNIVNNSFEKENEKGLKLSKTMVYVISILGLLIVAILGFCIMKFWK